MDHRKFHIQACCLTNSLLVPQPSVRTRGFNYQLRIWGEGRRLFRISLEMSVHVTKSHEGKISSRSWWTGYEGNKQKKGERVIRKHERQHLDKNTSALSLQIIHWFFFSVKHTFNIRLTSIWEWKCGQHRGKHWWHLYREKAGWTKRLLNL